MFPFFGSLMYLAVLIFWISVVWLFYRALSRIGEELSYIRGVLQERLPHPHPPRETII